MALRGQQYLWTVARLSQVSWCMFTAGAALSCTSQEGHRLDGRRGAAEQGDEADEAFGGMVASMDMPPHARAGQRHGRGHRFAAYPRCSTDVGSASTTASWLDRLVAGRSRSDA